LAGGRFLRGRHIAGCFESWSRACNTGLASNGLARTFVDRDLWAANSHPQSQ
jgi:hypothetical protein